MPTAERQMVAAIPVVDTDWYRCGGCGTRIALGLAPIRGGARTACQACGVWNLIELPEARE